MKPTSAESERCRDDQPSKPNSGVTLHPEKQKSHPRQGSPSGHEQGTLSKPNSGTMSPESSSNRSRKLGFDETHKELN